MQAGAPPHLLALPTPFLRSYHVSFTHDTIADSRRSRVGRSRRSFPFVSVPVRVVGVEWDCLTMRRAGKVMEVLRTTSVRHRQKRER